MSLVSVYRPVLMPTKTGIEKVLTYFWYYQILISQTALNSYSALLHLGIWTLITALYWYNNRNQFTQKFSTELHQSYYNNYFLWEGYKIMKVPKSNSYSPKLWTPHLKVQYINDADSYLQNSQGMGSSTLRWVEN
jgi:hypothetical protein